MSEEERIDISGVKSQFISIRVSKKIRVKISDQKGLDYFSSISFPETFDPTYFAHSSKVRNYDFRLSRITVNSFSGSIVNKDNIKRPIKYKRSVDRIFMDKGWSRFGSYENYEYKTTDLKIGDIVEIDYNYTVPFNDNFYQLLSFRLFFNDKIHKDYYSFVLTHNDKLFVDVALENLDEADSSSLFNGQKLYKWERKNLKGCISEVGSRPYKELEHMVISILPVSLYYKLPDSFLEKYLPTYSLYANRRESDHLSAIRSMNQGVHTPDLEKFYRYISSHTEKLPDDETGYETLKSIHTDITNRFIYENDYDWMNDSDSRGERLGAFMEKGVVREINRYTNYISIARKLNLFYFSAYLSDNRVGQLKGSYYSPMFDNDYLITPILKNNMLIYLYPKNKDFGYYINELPFYFTNTTVRFVHPYDYLVTNNEKLEIPRETTIRVSEKDENIRRTNVSVSVNTSNLTVDFKAKISLLGQFSTVGRGIYQKNYTDRSINPKYSQKLWGLDKDLIIKNESFEMKDFEPPYAAKIEGQYSGNHLISKVESNYEIDISNWFNHIIEEGLEVKKRQLDFYSDFRQKDSYVYYFQFDKDVVVDGIDDMLIENQFGKYEFSLSQLNPRTVKIVSYLEIDALVIPSEETQAVANIFNSIKNSNQQKIRITTIL